MSMTTGFDPGSRVGTIQHQQNTGSVQGAQNQFNGHQVEVGHAEPRATSALKTAWMEVKHFFTSLFGVRVSTPRPESMDTPNDAAAGVLHAMTRSKIDTLEVLDGLVAVLETGNFPQDAARDGINDGASRLFDTALQGLSDIQLFRLYGNFGKHAEFSENLAQLGTALVMGAEEPSIDKMRGGGKVNDLGFVALALREQCKLALEARGYEVGEVDDATAEAPRPMELFAQKVVDNGGDFATALQETRQQVAVERREAILSSLAASGLYDRTPVGAEQVPVEIAHGPIDAGHGGLRALRDQALQDPMLNRVVEKGSCNPNALLAFFSCNLEVCSSPEFWSDTRARMNADNFGAGLTLTVIQRIQEQGSVTQADLGRLADVLRPYPGEDMPMPDPSLVGPLTDQRLSDLCDLAFGRYFASDARFELNMEGRPHEHMVRGVFADPVSTGAEKLGAMIKAYQETLRGQYFGADNLQGPLQAIA